MSPILAAYFRPDEVSAVMLSLRVSTVATMLLLVPGVLLGVWLARTTSPWRSAVTTLTVAPLVVPPVVTGVLLLYLLRWVARDVLFTWWAAALAAAIVSAPLLIRTVWATVETLDPRFAQVATTLGASRWRVLRTITLPLAWKGIVGGALLAWARAVGEFGATIVVAGNFPGRTRTIPLAVWTALQSTPSRGVVGLVIAALLLSVAAVALSEGLIRWERTRRVHHRSERP